MRGSLLIDRLPAARAERLADHQWGVPDSGGAFLQGYTPQLAGADCGR